ncbi:ABC transporter ATP-binding protein [Robertkochia aurantiaca]|uniref:ABC transporter ATP-binding protein n=1 Tax=Robertkochia aurantiaca TaxID=2873700 RepID=UPI001CCD0490|nr:ATP-binding cassette domain-containing protein [Robertkochia sp. 3YJGBD-33]
MLVAEHVSKKYGQHLALDDVSIRIPKNSIFGLLGPNGAGKTTLIRIINQITYPDHGKVLFDGEPLERKHIAQIGYLPEERGLYKNMKVGEQAIYLARLKGLSKSDAKKELEYWFDRFGIVDWWHRKVQELSKGMAQKIQFIVTVLHKPKLLIFDEPFSGFDPINANLIKDEILNLQKQGATVIFSTHRMESVEELCEYIALINKSRKILDGKLIDIKRKHKSNTFDIGLELADKDKLRADLDERFTVSDAFFRSVGDELKVRVQLHNGATANDLLEYLSKRALITHFVEVIPTANDIFIQTINED